MPATAAERFQGVAHELLTRSGRPEVAILDATKECGADLIVITTHSDIIAPRAFCGSTAEKVLFGPSGRR
ncbi:MAG: universal stress protein [Candidatus Binataceae bacterium]